MACVCAVLYRQTRFAIFFLLTFSLCLKSKSLTHVPCSLRRSLLGFVGSRVCPFFSQHTTLFLLFLFSAQNAYTIYIKRCYCCAFVALFAFFSTFIIVCLLECDQCSQKIRCCFFFLSTIVNVTFIQLLCCTRNFIVPFSIFTTRKVIFFAIFSFLAWIRSEPK